MELLNCVKWILLSTLVSAVIQGGDATTASQPKPTASGTKAPVAAGTGVAAIAENPKATTAKSGLLANAPAEVQTTTIPQAPTTPEEQPKLVETIGAQKAKPITTKAPEIETSEAIEVITQGQGTTAGAAVDVTTAAQEVPAGIQVSTQKEKKAVETTQAAQDVQTTQKEGTVKETVQTTAQVVTTVKAAIVDVKTTQENQELTTDQQKITSSHPQLTTGISVDDPTDIVVEHKNTSVVEENVQTTIESAKQTSPEPKLTTEEATTGLPNIPARDIIDSGITESANDSVTTARAKKTSAPVTTAQQKTTTKPTIQPAPVVQTTQAKVPSDDPCDNYELLEDKERYITHKNTGTSPFCDTLKKKWYAFKYQGKWAEIPAEPVKTSYCGTDLPFRLETKDLPDFNKTITTNICTAAKVYGEMMECVIKKEIKIKACDGYYIYFLQPLTKNCNSAVCTILPGETIPYHVHVNPEPTEPSVKTAAPTQKPLPIRQIPLNSASKEEKAGIVTTEFSYPNVTLDEEFFITLETQIRTNVIKALNELSPEHEDRVQPTDTATQKAAVTGATNEFEETVTGNNKPTDSSGNRVKRQHGTPQYTEGDVIHINPTPRVKDGKLQMSIIVKDKDGNVVPANRLKQALENMENPSNDPDVVQERVYIGLPSDLEPSKRRTIWEAHMGLWITIICLVAVCLLTLIICCLCFRCCEATPPPQEKTPLQMEEGKKLPSVVIENPLPDEEITKDEAPMVEHENPAFTPNGGGQHLAKDEDNGYIVPLDQLTEEERKLVEIENTKL